MEFEELLFRAKRGERIAIQQIFEMFYPMMLKNSFVDGIFDEDLYQELLIEILRCIQCFTNFE